MWGYTLRRLLYAVPVLLGVSMLVFALIQLAPGRRRRHPGAARGAEGNRRRLAPAFPARRAGLHSVCGLAQPPARRRLRHFLLHQPAGRGRAVRGAGQHPCACLAGGGAGFSARGAARRAGRVQSRHLARQAVLRHRDHRRQPAALLGRHRAGCDLRRRSQHAAGAGHGLRGHPDELGACPASDPAGRYAVAHPDGRDQPAGARQRAGNPEPGVRRHAAREGSA